MFCSLAVDMRVTQLVDGNKGIHAMLPKRYANRGRIKKQAADRARHSSPPSWAHRYTEEVNMLDFEQCWAALERRDAGRGWRFFYGVRTTGVYCRAGCTSRLPLRKNTMFFETTAAAEAAGLRPCKRCRPTDGTSASRHVAAVEKACALLRNSDAIPSLAELADAAGISPFHFHRVSSRSPARRRAIMRGPIGSAVSPTSSRPVSRSPRRSTRRGSARARAPMKRLRQALGMTPGARRRGGSGRDDPLCHGRDPARLGIGRRDRARHLHDRARR